MFTEQEVRQIETIVEPIVKALGGKSTKSNTKEDEATKEHMLLRHQLVEGIVRIADNQENVTNDLLSEIAKGIGRVADALETILGEDGLKVNLTTTTIAHDDIIDAEIEEEHKLTK